MRLWDVGVVHNSHIDFYLLGDTNIQDPTVCKSSNCHFVRIRDIWARASSKLPIKTPQKTGMSTSDIKPALGFLFSDITSEYEWWGWTDIDLIYGDLRRCG